METIFRAQTDRDLLDRFRTTKDREAFTELVHRYGPVVFGICRRILGDDHSAEDAFQQTFMNLARFAHAIQQPEALAGWLHATARRAALAIAPHRGRVVSLHEEIVSQARDPLQEISGRELICAIEEELAVLPNAYRSAILLCGIEGLSVDEAAHRLGASNGSLRGWLQRGRELLKKRMTQRGLALPAALGALFGIPTPVSAATTSSTIDAALALPVAKPALLVKLLSSAAFKLVCAVLSLGAVILGWKYYLSTSEPTKPQLPPLQVAKWELSVDTPLPKGAILRLGDGRHTLQLGKKQIRFGDGSRKIVAVGDSEFIAWNVFTGEQIHRTAIEDEPGDVSPDGKWFVQLGNVYNALTGELVWKAFQDRRFDTVQFVGKSKVAMTFHRQKTREVMVRLLDVEAKTVKEATLAGFRAKPLSGGGFVAVWDRPEEDYGAVLADDNRDGEIRIHAFANLEKPVVLNGFKGEPLSVETDAAARRLFAVTPDGQLSCWNTATGERIYNAKATIPRDRSSRLMPDGRTLNYFNLWNMDPLAVAPKGDKLVWRNCEDSSLLEYSCHSVESRKLIWSARHDHFGKTSFLFDETNDRLIVNNQKIEIRNLESGELLSPQTSQYADRGPSYLSRAMALSDDARLIAFSNHDIGLYDINKLLDPSSSSTKTPETSWREDNVASVGFVPGSNKLVWATNSKMMIYDVDERKIIDSAVITSRIITSRIQGPFAGPNWVSFHRLNLKWIDFTWDGTRLLKTERPASALKNVITNNRLTGFEYAHADRFYFGELEAGEKPRAFVTCWDVFTGEKKWVYCIEPDPDLISQGVPASDGSTHFPEHQAIKFIALSEVNKLVVLTRTRAILLDSTLGQELKTISSGNTKNKRIEFDNAEISDDGSILVIGVRTEGHQKSELQFYRTKDFGPAAKSIDLADLGSYNNLDTNIYIALSHDTKLVAAAHSRGRGGLEVFDIASGNLKCRLPQMKYCNGLGFSVDGRRLVTKEPNGNTALVWDLNAFVEK